MPIRSGHAGAEAEHADGGQPGGFGLRGEHIHAADERIALDSIGPVYRIYRAALDRLQRG